MIFEEIVAADEADPVPEAKVGRDRRRREIGDQTTATKEKKILQGGDKEIVTRPKENSTKRTTIIMNNADLCPDRTDREAARRRRIVEG